MSGSEVIHVLAATDSMATIWRYVPKGRLSNICIPEANAFFLAQTVSKLMHTEK
jgi:hypothetical protein